MPTRAKIYIGAVIAAGIFAMAAGAGQWAPPAVVPFAVYAILAVGASLLKIRLPGVEGTYSLNFFFILVGIVYFSLPETLAAAMAAAGVQTFLNTKQRPAAIQFVFNTANLAVSIWVSFLLVSGPLAAGMESYRPAAIAAVAFTYFVVNTLLVSGVLALLNGRGLLAVCEQWYVWSFPYYLVGVVVVALLPLGDHPMEAFAWLAVAPPLYLLYFFYALSRQSMPGHSDGAGETAALSQAARIYIAGVAIAGVALLSRSIAFCEPEDWTRLGVYAVIAVLTSGLKVRLPRVTGTVSVNFVILLAAIAELSFAEVILLAAICAIVQTYWVIGYRPMVIQVVFNAAVLLASSALAVGVYHWLHGSVDVPMAVSLMGATAVQYFTNTALVAAVLCLAERQAFGRMWQGCYYWSLPYYLVGAMFAVAIASTSETAGWILAFLCLPLMVLVYISYRTHLRPLSHLAVRNG